MRYFSLWQFIVVLLLLVCQHLHAEQGKHLFILSGQSNMRAPLPEVFQDAVSRVFGKEKVIVVMTGHPGQPIKNWYKAWQPPQGMTDPNPASNGKLYDTLIAAVKKSVGNQQLASVTFIWMQGESDATSGWGSVYEASFRGILEQIKSDLAIKQIQFVIGRINDFWIDPQRFPDGELIRSIQQKVGKESALGSWINTDDLNHGVNPWGGFSFDDGHFPNPGYRVMGQRFAKQACLLIDPQLKLDPQIFAERFFDSATQVKQHTAMGKSIRGTEPSPKYNASEKGLAVLTDGRYGKADQSDTAWLGFAPSETEIELILDLGQETAITDIGLNMLLSSAVSAEFPDQFTFTVSKDGVNYSGTGGRFSNIRFYEPKKLEQLRKAGIKPQSVLLLKEQNNLSARYVKLQIKTGKQWVFLDEVIINPATAESEK